MITYPTPAANTPYPNGVNHVNSTLGANNSANTVDRFWVVSKTGPGNGPTTLAFSFGDGERPVAMSSTGPVQGKAQPWGAAGGWRIAPNSASQTMLALGGTGCLALPNVCSQRVSQVVVPTYAWTYGNSSPWAIANASSPLPIKLISFDAKAIDDHTKINWVTASEENNDYFTVQRTNDFNTMVDIAKIPTQNGNSNQIQYYETYDQHPIKGINYYRLLQTDMGGVAEPASDYVAVRFGVKSTFDILFISTENQVEVNFEYDSELPLNYTVSDMLGKTIASGANNAASPGVNLLKLDASAWPHGMYLITLQNKEKSVTRKMVY